MLSKRFPHIRHRCTSKLSLPPEHYQAVSAAAEAFNNGLNHSNSTSNIRTVIENNIVKSPIDGGVAELPSYHPWKKSSNFPSFMVRTSPSTSCSFVTLFLAAWKQTSFGEFCKRQGRNDKVCLVRRNGNDGLY